MKHTIKSIQTKSFVFLILLPTILIVALFGYVIRYQMIKSAEKTLVSTVKQHAVNIETELENDSLLSSALLHDKELMNLSRVYVATVDPIEKFRIQERIERILEGPFLITNFVGAITLLYRNGQDFHVARNTQNVITSVDAINALVPSENGTKDRVIFIDDLKGVLPSTENAPYLVKTVIWPSQVFGYKHEYQLLFSCFESTAIKVFLEEMGGRDGMQSFIVSSEGIILSASDDALIGNRFDVSARRAITISTDLDAVPWKVVTRVPIASFTQHTDLYLGMLFASLVLVLFLFLFYNIGFSNHIARPLQRLTGAAKAVGDGDFSIKVESSSYQEVDSLSAAFNEMVHEVDSLTHRISAEEKEKLALEIDALRFQLNPHFLCNTLNSIRMMAILSHNEEIKEMCGNLMRVMDENLRGSQAQNTIEREVRNLVSYVEIMKVRFGNKFTFDIDIPESLRSYVVPSMILQPIVENSILHGIRNMQGQGVIYVRAWQIGNDIKLIVQDNGVGMDRAKCRSILTGEASHTRGFNHIGVASVHRRLVLLFGKDYGLTVESALGLGTSVHILLRSTHQEGEASEIRERGEDETITC